ncbi:MAG: low specificity L-threonine aldolase [Clostridiaceae bacterium]|nr:low specificity L-threonine aldolase [Clostridiaceae bacterium]
MKFIDMRSDTVTWPTEEMRKAMAVAEVGDDVYGDDPTVNKLEEMAAQILNKEAAMFVPTGTMGNQLAVFTAINRGDEVIIAEDNHIVVHECGAAGVISGANLRCLPSNKGMVDLKLLDRTIRFGEDIHEPKTGLICTENAHSTGVVHPLSYMKELYEIGRKNNIHVHLDGARIFNAASYLKVEASEIARYADSVMFCLSKGLCAPVGSMLVGTKAFIDAARRKRKLLGGGMRQVGILAQAGIIALEKMTKRVHEDHENARYLAELLKDIPGITVNTDDVHINMVFFQIEKPVSGEYITCELKKEGILANPPDKGTMRLVTHYYIKREHVEKTIQVLRRIMNAI